VDALRRVGARTVERDGERVLALFPPPRDPAALVAEAAGVIRASTSLLPGFHAVLAPTGWLAISGVVRVERTAVLEAAANEGLVPADEEMEGGWWSARLCSSGSAPRARPPR
jgi:hypothetical protein